MTTRYNLGPSDGPKLPGAVVNATTEDMAKELRRRERRVKPVSGDPKYQKKLSEFIARKCVDAAVDLSWAITNGVDPRGAAANLAALALLASATYPREKGKEAQAG